MLTPRQELILGKVVARFRETGLPVGSKLLAGDPDLGLGPSTIRNELALLEGQGLLNHPHTSAGRVPTDAGHRYFVDHLLPAAPSGPGDPGIELALVQHEIDDAMRVTSETLSTVTDLLAVVTAPPVSTATVRHVEVLLLHPRSVMVVVITSAGDVAKRTIGFRDPVDPGLASWAREYLNDRLVGIGLGARMLRARLEDPSLGATEQAFLAALRPVFGGLAEGAGDAATGGVYVSGAARLMQDARTDDVAELDALVDELERRATILRMLRQALRSPGVVVRIGAENPVPALRSLSVVAAGYGPPQRNLGSVSVIGPVRMDYPVAIRAVRDVAFQLSRYVEELYENV